MRFMVVAALALPLVGAHPGTRHSDPALCSTSVADRGHGPFGPEYYSFDLVTTKRIPGTGLARGVAEIAPPASSPFAVALSEDGSYRYAVEVRIERAKPLRSGVLVAWVATPQLDRVRRIGPLDHALSARGSVDWNKFIVVVSLEPSSDPNAERWTGPIAFRGMSRSGAMHTMVGHGALQQENCAAWGYQ
ncbi:MAG: hypothetical protein J4G12_09375 [Gemmatimonadetes bacterium]|nr:hypothetical protein [Gemmatimonadota bacterium]